MADNTWYMDLESKVYSIIKAKTYETLKKDYPNIRFTTNSENVEPITVFPTIYIHQISAIPVGNDMGLNAVNGVNTTFELRVTTNTQKTDAKAVTTAISEAFASIGFSATSLPIYSSESNMFIYNARYRRVVGSLDTF